jgi:ribose transport system substrate-binding protein
MRLLAPLLSVLLLVSFAGCRKSNRKSIAVIAQGRTHLFWQSIHAGAAAAARELDVEILWNAPASETDYAAQLQIVNAMITRRVDAIAVCPMDKTAMIGVVDRAAREGIPVIIFDTGVDTESYVARVATDNYGAGRLAGRRMGEILGRKGTVVIVACVPGSASTLAREQGFEDELREHSPGIRILDKRFGMSDFAKSLAVAENMLTAHPGVDAVFASNETSTVGAAQAVKARGSKVKLVGFDSSPTLLADLEAGLIDSLVVQHAWKMGYEAVSLAVRKLRGETPPKENPLPARLVTRANMNEPEIYLQLHPKLEF